MWDQILKLTSKITRIEKGKSTRSKLQNCFKNFQTQQLRNNEFNNTKARERLLRGYRIFRYVIVGKGMFDVAVEGSQRKLNFQNWFGEASISATRAAQN